LKLAGMNAAIIAAVPAKSQSARFTGPASLLVAFTGADTLYEKPRPGEAPIFVCDSPQGA